MQRTMCRLVRTRSIRNANMASGVSSMPSFLASFSKAARTLKERIMNMKERQRETRAARSPPQIHRACRGWALPLSWECCWCLPENSHPPPGCRWRGTRLACFQPQPGSRACADLTNGINTHQKKCHTTESKSWSNLTNQFDHKTIGVSLPNISIKNLWSANITIPLSLFILQHHMALWPNHNPR